MSLAEPEADEELDEPEESGCDTNAPEVNRLSMKHMSEEMNEVNRQSIVKSPVNPTNGHESDAEGNEIVLKQQRINELEMELESLNNKLKNIEACLARWIFRACDYKLDLDKLKEKSEVYEQQRVELEQTRTKLADALGRVDVLTNELEIK